MNREQTPERNIIRDVAPPGAPLRVDRRRAPARNEIRVPQIMWPPASPKTPEKSARQRRLRAAAKSLRKTLT